MSELLLNDHLPSHYEKVVCIPVGYAFHNAAPWFTTECLVFPNTSLYTNKTNQFWNIPVQKQCLQNTVGDQVTLPLTGCDSGKIFGESISTNRSKVVISNQIDKFQSANRSVVYQLTNQKPPSRLTHSI